MPERANLSDEKGDVPGPLNHREERMPSLAAAQLSVRDSVLTEAVNHQTSKRPERHKPSRV